MKIAILGSRGIPAKYGGFETFAERLAIGLTNRGINVTVFCEGDPSCSPQEWRGVALKYLPSSASGPLRTIVWDCRCLMAARTGYDVVYMLGYGSAPFCLIPRLWGSKVWINPDGIEWARAKWGWVAKIYFRLMEWMTVRVANRIIADAQAIADHIGARHRTRVAMSVIAYGCDLIEAPPPTEPLLRWNLKPGEYHIVVCRLEPENHLLEILQAFQASRSKKSLIVVGNVSGTPYTKKLEMIRDSRIRLVGTIYDPTQLIPLRYHASAYIHGHSVGGTNPSLLEAMGCGNLVLAHDNPYTRETLASCGYYFATVAQLTGILDRIENLPTEVLDNLRQECRSRARTFYHWEDIISRYYDLLTQRG